jgi:hypothetical protein
MILIYPCLKVLPELLFLIYFVHRVIFGIAYLVICSFFQWDHMHMNEEVCKMLCTHL